MFVEFSQWTKDRAVASLGTNSGSLALPFQGWRHFKEAFAPEIVDEAIRSSRIPVATCLDPFGGSGTTPLACQFLGVKPIAIEVNPYLADLIEAKLAQYDTERLLNSLTGVLRGARADASAVVTNQLPATFVEPGVDGRWIFNHDVAVAILRLRGAIEATPDPVTRRLFKVLLGGVLIPLSNVVINGKGRRYRRGWEKRSCSAADVINAFADAASQAIGEIDRFARRKQTLSVVLTGDARRLCRDLEPIDLAVFSPPYPNSFDYTDVYNVELWMLGYLADFSANRALRSQTLSSHVQIHRPFGAAPTTSSSLNGVLNELSENRAALWNRNIPEMVGGYFHDMAGVVQSIAAVLRRHGSIWMVVGDSKYGTTAIPCADILAEIGEAIGLVVDRVETLRDMRASAQQGGQFQLAESLVVLRRP
jgi:hypothetical protein